MRCPLFVVLALTACETPDVIVDWSNDRAASSATCVDPLGPTDFDTLHQGLTVPDQSAFAYVGDTPVISGTSIAIGGLYTVQFFELDASGTYAPTTQLTGPSGHAFGRELTLSDGRAFIGETTFQEPGSSALTGRVSAWQRDDQGQWSLDPHTPYITAADMGLTSGSASIGVGYEIQMRGDTAVVGAQRADQNGATSKAVFRYSDAAGWEREALWTNSSTGTSAIQDDYVAFFKSGSFTVEVYKRTNGAWSNAPVATISRPAAGSSQYGRCSNCLKFDGDRLIIGDIYTNSQVGGAFVFERQPNAEGFSLIQTLLPPNHGSQYGDLWGITLGTSQDRLYVGSGNANRVRSYSWDDASGQYVFNNTIADGIDSGLGRGISVDGSRLLLGRGTAARSEGTATDRARLYIGDEGVYGSCDVPTPCPAGTDFDWDGDGQDDGCRGANVSVDPSVVMPQGTRVGDNVTVLAGARLGSGNILEDDVIIGAGTVLGDNNTLSASTVLNRRTTLGSNNILLPDTVVGRSVVVGDNSTLGGVLGYGVEVGSHVNLPDLTVGSLVIIGSDTTAPGQIDCPGPLIAARSTVIADDPAHGFRCTGSVVIGPDSTVEDADMGADVRVRKQSFFGTQVTVGSNIRIGRNTYVRDGVELADGVRMDTGVEVCDAAAPITGRLARGYVDITCP